MQSAVYLIGNDARRCARKCGRRISRSRFRWVTPPLISNAFAMPPVRQVRVGERTALALVRERKLFEPVQQTMNW
jgi:hypothetical protein